MNTTRINQLLNSTSIAKISAFSIALFIWSLMTSWRILEITQLIPLHFYTKLYTITQIPQTIQVTLKGPRTALKQIDWKSLAAHIDLDQVKNPQVPFMLVQEHLNLPNTIKLLSSNPSSLALQLTPQGTHTENL
ncbi:MAG: CdaR family protein [Candidatus Babeliaceae bacterium]